MRSPLTETIKRVEGMIAYVRENLDEGEYDLFLDLILPEPEPVKAVKKGRKKSSKGGSKSSRASSLQQQLKATAPRTITGPACSVCGNVEDHPDHDTAHYLSAHEFDSGKLVAYEAGAGG